MPKAIPQSELETIHRIVKQIPAGASFEDIRRKLNIESSRRTLQRRLALLVEQGRLVLEGRGRGSRYRLPLESDVDIVVAFDGPATSRRYFGVQFLLEDALSHPVDLVTEKAMRPELQPFIYEELVNV